MESSDPGASGKGDERSSKRARVESGGNAKLEESQSEGSSNDNSENPSTRWDEYDDEEIKPPEPPIPQAPSKEYTIHTYHTRICVQYVSRMLQ